MVEAACEASTSQIAMLKRSVVGATSSMVTVVPAAKVTRAQATPVTDTVPDRASVATKASKSSFGAVVENAGEAIVVAAVVRSVDVVTSTATAANAGRPPARNIAVIRNRDRR